MDFGIIQMISNVDRADLKSNHLMNLIQFGHNTLHHLFPSLDHALLPQLRPVFLETCREFEVKMREQSWCSHVLAHFQLLKRVQPISLKEMKLWIRTW